MYLANEFCHFEAGIQYSLRTNDFQRNIIMTLDQYATFRKEQMPYQYGLFVTAYRYDQPNIREANMIGNLYIDFDVTNIEDNFEQIRQDAIRTISALKAIFGIEKESIQIYFSGNKGIHFIIPAEVMGVQPHQELHDIFKLIAEDMKKLTKHQTVDTQIYDKVRLFRIPNSVNLKTGLYKVPLHFEELRTLTLGELQKLAEKPRKAIPVSKEYSTDANRVYQHYVKDWEKQKKERENRKKRQREQTLNFMPPCIQHLITEGAPEGKRNNTAAVLASYFLQRGVKEQEAMERVLNWNDEKCVPSLPTREIEKTVQSIYGREHRYGCRALRELSICDTECPIHKAEEDRRNQHVR